MAEQKETEGRAKGRGALLVPTRDYSTATGWAQCATIILLVDAPAYAGILPACCSDPARARPTVCILYAQGRLVPLLRYIITAIAAALALIPQLAHACTCDPQPPTLEAHSQATLVFAGNVSAIVGNPADEGASQLVTFDLQELWKGPEQAQVTLLTPSGSANCGYAFEPGTSYLVYATVEGVELTTSSCTRTAPLTAASSDIAALGPGIPIANGISTVSSLDMDIPWLPVIMIVASLLIAAALFGPSLLGRRR